MKKSKYREVFGFFQQYIDISPGIASSDYIVNEEQMRLRGFCRISSIRIYFVLNLNFSLRRAEVFSLRRDLFLKQEGLMRSPCYTGEGLCHSIGMIGARGRIYEESIRSPGKTRQWNQLALEDLMPFRFC